MHGWFPKGRPPATRTCGPAVLLPLMGVDSRLVTNLTIVCRFDGESSTKWLATELAKVGVLFPTSEVRRFSTAL